MITLITGGARSGKTRYALSNAGTGGPKTYIATAELLDDEMHRRAQRHRAERGSHWQTIEEPRCIDEHLKRLHGTVVVDCLTLWLSNWMLAAELEVDSEIVKLCEVLRIAPADVQVISNEVGCSIVPENALGRRFRDYSGLLNQQVAEVANHVLLMVCGVPVRVK